MSGYLAAARDAAIVLVALLIVASFIYCVVTPRNR